MVKHGRDANVAFAFGRKFRPVGRHGCVEIDFALLEGEGHGTGAFGGDRVLGDLAGFLTRHLRRADGSVPEQKGSRFGFSLLSAESMQERFRAAFDNDTALTDDEKTMFGYISELDAAVAAAKAVPQSRAARRGS